MTERDKLLVISRQIVSDHQAGYSSPVMPSLKLAEQVIDELDPQPRELWGRKAQVGEWCNFDRVEVGVNANRIIVYGPTKAAAIRRFNAAAEAIDRSDKEAADGA